MKKLLATLLATTMAVSAIGGLVACGEEEPEKVAATNISLTNVYGQAVTSVTIAPDGKVGVLAKLTPANTTSDVTWSVTGTNNITVKPGGVNNSQVFLSCTDYTPNETVKLVATIDGKKVEVPVNIQDWPRFMICGGGDIKGDGWTDSVLDWNPSRVYEPDADGNFDYSWMFVQDANDKHLWTADITYTSTNWAGWKIVSAALNDDGYYQGKGWDTQIRMKNVEQEGSDEWSEEELAKPESERRKLKKDGVEGTEGELNVIAKDGADCNISLGATGTPGKYRFTLKTKEGGGFESLTYKRIGDVE